MLEDSTIEGYTVIPKFGQIGFEIAAFTFMKTKLHHKKGAEQEEIFNKLKEHYLKQPNVVTVMSGQGMGWTQYAFHCMKTILTLPSFCEIQESELSDIIIATESFQADLKAWSAC